jgi:hypothetical protein
MSDKFHEAMSRNVATEQERALARIDAAYELPQLRIALRHEFSLIRSEIRAGAAEYRILMVIVGAAIIAAAVAMTYP